MRGSNPRASSAASGAGGWPCVASGPSGQAGAAVLLSTHVLDTLEKVATRILMVQGGRLIADVGADELDSVRGMF